MKVEIKKFITKDINTFEDNYRESDIILVSKYIDIIKNPKNIGNLEVGVDLYNLEEFEMKPRERGKLVKTGVKSACKPGLHFEVKPRSSLGLKTPLRLSNSIGTIDPTYRGDIGLIFDNISDEKYFVEKQTKLCQLCCIPYIPMNSDNYIINFYECLNIHYYLSEEIYNKFDKLLPSYRGEDGFGSTGN